MQPAFEHGALKRDIQQLSQEVKEHREKTSSAEMHEREAVKSVLGTRIQTFAPSSTAQSNTSQLLPQYLQQESSEVKLKVEELIDLALHKGVDASIKEAGKFGPFILDALHDALTTKIYDELKARKLI